MFMIENDSFSTDIIFNRLQLLTGRVGFDRLQNARVIIVGVGGVGSWAAESLVRSGVGNLTICDADTVAPSNINRQLPATCSTVGKVKTTVLADRLRDINPAVSLTTISEKFSSATAAAFDIGSYDCVIDAIDSLADKAALIVEATSYGSATKLYSSMGAALRINPTAIHVAEFWKVYGDPLAAALRRRFRKSGIYPRRKFKCVYSDELLRNASDVLPDCSDPSMSCDKVSVNGAVAHITAIFGFTLAGLVVNDILAR